MNLTRQSKKLGKITSLKRKIIKFTNFLIFFVITIVLVGVGYYIFNLSDLFKISNIEISGTRSFVSYRDMTEILQTKLYEKNIFTINIDEVRETLSETFQGAKTVSVKRKLPNKITVLVKERVPLALIYNANSSSMFMIDEDGYVLGIVDETSTNLTKIKYEGDIKVGMFISKTLVPVYLELTRVLRDEDIMVSSMSFYPRYVELYLEKGIRTFISSEKDIPVSIKILVAMLKQVALEGKLLRSIDLRYAKVIVSYD